MYRLISEIAYKNILKEYSNIKLKSFQINRRFLYQQINFLVG